MAANTVAMTGAELTQLQELMSKAATTKLTASESIQFNQLLGKQAAMLASARNVAKESGIVVASNKDTTAIGSVVEDFIYQAEGVRMWHSYRLERIRRSYNEVAERLKMPIAQTNEELTSILDELPTKYPQFSGAVTEGRDKGRTRYNNQWPKEIAAYARMMAERPKN